MRRPKPSAQLWSATTARSPSSHWLQPWISTTSTRRRSHVRRAHQSRPGPAPGHRRAAGRHVAPARYTTRQPNAPAFDARAALHAILGIELTQIHGLGPALALKRVGECGTAPSAWPSAKHFTPWLCLAPSHKISGGTVLASRTRRSANRAAALLRLAATTVGRTDTALGAFYHRLSARVGKAKAVPRPARSPCSSTTPCATGWTTPTRAPPIMRSATGDGC